MSALFWAIFGAALLVAQPASAGPVVAAIVSIFSGVSATLAAGGIGAFLIRTAVAVGLSLLAQALLPKPRQPGIRTQVTTTGGVTPATFILGRYATAGALVAPHYSHGSSRSLLTYVIAVSDLPVEGLSRLIIENDYVALVPDTSGHALDLVVDSPDHPGARLTFHDGRQTVADAYLIDRFAAHPDRPWSADMVGTGVAYAVLEFRFNREKYQSKPRVRFEVDGIALYDPRADSTRGGDGPQRADNPATWAFSDNPVVMIYNILRGVPLPDGSVWGGAPEFSEQPLDNWVAAMNACDVLVDIGGGNFEPAYRAGLEVSVDDEPAEIVEELLKSCAGQMAEIGGVWRIRVGPPALPVLFLTDEDIAITADQVMTPFPGLQASNNAVQASYPEPAALWEAKDAPPRFSDALEAEDGGRRLVAEVTLPAVPYPLQVQRLMQAWIEEERRFRRHRILLPPLAAILEPLDAIEWTSARNGYVEKVFEVHSIEDDQRTVNQLVGLRERDPGDYDWAPGDALPWQVSAAGVTPPAAQEVAGFAAAPFALPDASDTDRRAAIRLVWDTPPPPDATALEWQLRRDGVAEVLLDGVANPAEGQVVITAILPGEVYEVRARYTVRRPRAWTDWVEVTAPGVLLRSQDIASQELTRVFSSDGSAVMWSRGGVSGDYGSWIGGPPGADGYIVPSPPPERLIVRGFAPLDGVTVTAYESGTTERVFRASMRQRLFVNATLLRTRQRQFFVFTSASGALVSTVRAIDPSPFEDTMVLGADYVAGDAISVGFQVFLDRPSGDAEVLIEGSFSFLDVDAFFR